MYSKSGGGITARQSNNRGKQYSGSGWGWSAPWPKMGAGDGGGVKMRRRPAEELRMRLFSADWIAGMAEYCKFRQPCACGSRVPAAIWRPVLKNKCK